MEHWTTRRIVILTLTVGTVLYLVYYVPGAVGHFVGRVWDLVVMLILASALAVVLAPPVEVLCRLKVPAPERAKRMVATILVLAVLVWAMWSLLSLTATQMIHEGERMVSIGKLWLSSAPGELQEWLDAHAEQMPPGVIDRATETVAQWTQTLLQYQFDFAKGALLRGWYLVELLVVPVLAFYFLIDGKALREGSMRFMPSRYRPFVDAVLDDAGALLDGYVRAQVVLCVVKGVLVGLVLYLCGVSMYLTLAIIAAAFRMAPVIGPLVAGIPCVGIPLLQNGLGTGLIVLLFYALLILIDGKLITPIVLGGSATLHPVVVILSLLLGYEFMGVLGLLIAVPVAGIVRVVYVRYQETFGDANAHGEQPESRSEESGVERQDSGVRSQESE